MIHLKEALFGGSCMPVPQKGRNLIAMNWCSSLPVAVISGLLVFYREKFTENTRG
jgi:hypothetical protein